MRHFSRHWLVMPVAMAAATLVQASQPFSFDHAFGRLPKDVVPGRYQVELTPDIPAMNMRGEEMVVLQFRKASARVQFNSFHQTLSETTLDGQPVASVNSDDSAQLTTIRLAHPAPAGRHTLRFTFTGKLDDSPQGLFRQDYVDPSGTKGYLLSSLMESIFARHVFPCWDEPAFRARFELGITAPKAWTAVSNMPVATRTVTGRLATTHFAPTPKMPSYLVELSVGDLASISATSGGTEFGIWALRGQENNGRFALENAQQILADYNEYFGIHYPLPKLDSIAVPGGFPGAMENWGAITYNERVLLLTGSSTTGDRQQIYSVQAHEMAHLWFGDLVTMGWWDDIWLNESFASWMAARETDLRNPTWHWWLGQDEDKENAMHADALAGVHAIEQHITDENLVDNSFDPQITYSKGQAILRMLEAWLGPDTFRAGVQRYMKARAYSNATSADLWQALGAASHHDVTRVSASWTEKPGFPLLDVTAHCTPQGARTITATQQRFLMDGTETMPSDWKVPLLIRSGVDTATHPALLDDPAAPISAGRCGEALSVNANAIGYFRVHYDADTLKANLQAFNTLPAGDRLALLDDQWSMAAAGRAPLADYLSLAERLTPDDEPLAWQQVASAMDAMELAERGSPGHDAIIAYMRRLLKPALLSLGCASPTGEIPDRRALRQQLITSLGTWGDPEVLEQTRKRYLAFVADHGAVPPDEQPAMLSVVASQADPATFEQLLGIARGARDAAEISRYYGALEKVQDPVLAARVIDLALGKQLPPQANNLPLQMIFGVADRHQQLAWPAYSSHIDQLLAFDPMFASLTITQGTPAAFWPGVALKDIETFMHAHIAADMAQEVERGMQVARAQLHRREILVPATDAWLRH